MRPSTLGLVTRRGPSQVLPAFLHGVEAGRIGGLIRKLIREHEKLVLRERRSPRGNGFSFLLTAFVARIRDDRDHPTRTQELQARVEGTTRRRRLCGHRMVPSRQVSEVEHNCSHGPDVAFAQMRRHRLVPGMDEAQPIGRIRRLGLHSLSSGCQGFRLNVKPDHMAAGPHLPNQKQRVVAVAHGGVNGEPAGRQCRGRQGMSKIQKRGNSGHGIIMACTVEVGMIDLLRQDCEWISCEWVGCQWVGRRNEFSTEQNPSRFQHVQNSSLLHTRPHPMAVQVDLDARSYTVHFRSLASVPTLLEDAGLRPGRCLLVSDENVAAHYRMPLTEGLSNAGWTVRSIVLPPGEQTKSASALHSVYDEALGWGIDRTTPVLALGGGVIGDLAGFAAATLLRGLPLVQLPTSLLAQVDASVGGKTAINHDTGKNLIGAFYQPQVVCADPNTLDTLPMREYTSAMAEVVKHALIKSPALFETLDNNLVAVFSYKDRDLVSEVIERAVQVKAEVVSADEREEGRRAILNFGHTFAHAIERVAGYGVFTHGEAVALGMRAGIYLSHQKHPTAIPRDRLARVVDAIPVQSDPSSIPFADVYDAMSADKKNQGDIIRFVLLRRLGEAYVTGDVSESNARQAWVFACAS